MPAAYPISIRSKALNVFSADESKSARIEIATSASGDELVIAHDDGLLPVYIPGALVVLDGVDKINVAGKLSAVSSSVVTEKDRAIAAEGQLSTAVSAEASRAEAAEGALTTAVSNEVARAQSAESSNASALASETAARITAVQTITNGLADELTARSAADGVHTSAIASNAAAIAAETSARDLALTDLNFVITNNKAEHYGVTNGLSTALNNENVRALAAEGLLQSRIDNEVAARGSAITTAATNAATNLSAEQTRAEGVESGLQAQISSILSNTDAVALNSLAELVTEFTQNGSTIASSVTAETTRAEAIEADLRARIADLEAAINALQSQAPPGEGGVDENAEAEA